MRIANLICTLLICCTTAGAQIKTYQLSLKDSTISLLYKSVPNRIRIIGLKTGDQVLFGNDVLHKTNSDTYILTPINDSLDSIVVKRQSQIIFSKRFFVTRIPDPTVEFGIVRNPVSRQQSRTHYTSVREILAYSTLVIQTGYLKSLFRLESFEIAIDTNGFYKNWTNPNEGYLTQEQIKLIENLHSGSKIYIENIRVIGPDNTSRVYANLQLIIR